MAKMLPFQRTGRLISEIDEFIDKVSQAAMVIERSFLHYLDSGPDDDLSEKVKQILEIEKRADELRRNVANVMYTNMLMPDTRGDVLNLLNQVDIILDDCVHMLVELSMERPDLPQEVIGGFRAMMGEVAEAIQAMLRGARAYFKDPNAVRDHVHKIDFHDKEATAIGLRAGKAMFDSELPLERKQQLRDWFTKVRELASHANDIGDQLAILAVKRSI